MHSYAMHLFRQNLYINVALMHDDKSR